MTDLTAFEPNHVITLTSDFGLRDGYVGAMKGAALSVDMSLRLVDIAHDLPPQDIVHAARALVASAPRFPVGTVHVVVVDPGVGTSRAPIVLVAGGHVFVGPDNGVFSLVAEDLGGATACHRIADNPHIAPSTSATFHGRDLFAPTGAALASGRLALMDVGPPHKPLLARVETESTVTPDRVEGQVVLVDRFGNLVTNITEADLASMSTDVVISVQGQPLPLSKTYGDAEVGAPLALIGSEGWLEIAIRDGSALNHLGLGIATTIIATAKAST